MRHRQVAFLMESGMLGVVRLWLYWLVVFILQKPLFMLCYRGLFGNNGAADWLSVCRHGLPLDVSMSGYLVSLPLVLVLVGIWKPLRVLRGCCRAWLFLSSLLVALTFLLNVVLYDYWSFPLDSTPLFYFFSSPKDALASASSYGLVLGLLLLLFLAFVLYFGASWAFRLRLMGKGKRLMLGQQMGATALALLLGGLFFLGIRGGVTVSSMNTGKVYFSQQQTLNHAAVNPMFSLMESLLHQNDFGKQYRLMDDEMASRLFEQMTRKGTGQTDTLLTTRRPDVYLVILESFSSKLMKTLGGNGVAASLDSLGAEGVLFTNFYANSFRTDRGLVSILCGYPAQPTMSLMKYPRKTASLPSMAKSMKKAGYDLAYYYGGDADFTNMRSFLVSQGFVQLVSDVDFPVKDRLSKWGVPDHLVFRRMEADLQNLWNQRVPGKHAAPLLRVVQTSSSHEPFDVPYQQLSDERLNAFAYADRCVGQFVEWLRHTDRWQRSLVILVPDHQGCYPRNMSNFDFAHYQIPLILTGGAIIGKRTVHVVGAQQDLAATVLSQLGIDHSEFTFSKDLLDTTSPHFAFFTVPDAFGIVDDEGHRLIYDNKSESIAAGEHHEQLMQAGKAYLQKLYDDIDKR